MMNVYIISWGLLIDNLLPIALRKDFTRTLFRIFVLPVSILYNDFLAFRESCLFRIQHNSQICYMQDMLNTLFDNSERRIRIVNTVFKEPMYFYEPEDNKDVYFYDGQDRYFREAEDFEGEGVDFVVCIPPDLKPEGDAETTAFITRVSAQIDYYKLYSKNYSILWAQVNI